MTHPIPDLKPGDYTKDAWIQPTEDSQWLYICEYHLDGVTIFFRDGIKVEPFDFDKEVREAYMRAEYHLREGMWREMKPWTA